MRRSRRKVLGKGVILDHQHDELGLAVSEPFRKVAAACETKAATNVVRLWAKATYGAEAKRFKEEFPDLWTKIAKVNALTDKHWTTFQLGFEIPDRNFGSWSVHDPGVMAFAEPDDKEVLGRVRELREKAAKTRKLLVEWLGASGMEDWSQVPYWFSDLKNWLPQGKVQKRPRAGMPPPKELYDLVREAVILKEAKV